MSTNVWCNTSAFIFLLEKQRVCIYFQGTGFFREYWSGEHGSEKWVKQWKHRFDPTYWQWAVTSWVSQSLLWGIQACGETAMFWVSDICCTRCALQKPPVKVYFRLEDTKRKKNKSKPLNQKNEYFRLLKLKCVAYNKNILIWFDKLIHLIFSLRQTHRNLSLAHWRYQPINTERLWSTAPSVGLSCFLDRGQSLIQCQYMLPV